MNKYRDWLKKELNNIVAGLNPAEGKLSYTAKTTLNTKYSAFQKSLEMYEKYHPKPVVPQFVADWYEENKDNLDSEIFGLCIDAGISNDRDDLKDWFMKHDSSIEILLGMKCFGYEVEKENQKFHLKHKHLFLENNQNYLSLDAYGYYLSGDTGKKDSDVQTEFTQEEIDSLPFKIDSDTWDQDDVNKNDDVIVSKYYQDANPNVKPKRKGYV